MRMEFLIYIYVHIDSISVFLARPLAGRQAGNEEQK